MDRLGHRGALAVSIILVVAVIGAILLCAGALYFIGPELMRRMSSPPVAVVTILAPAPKPSATLMATFTMEATHIPLPTDTVTLAPTSIPEPRMGNFRFCDRPCDESGALQLSILPERTSQIFVSWDYSGMKVGMKYARYWTFGGAEWVRYNCVWQGPEAGTFAVRLWDTGGLPSGEWSVAITVEGRIVGQATIAIAGTYETWAPAGELPCRDF